MTQICDVDPILGFLLITTHGGLQCIVKDTLRMAQYWVILDWEEYIVEGKQVEALSDHVRLPAGCGLEVCGCEMNEQTYIHLDCTR